MQYQNFDTYILKIGFIGRKVNYCVYFKLVGDRLIYLILFLDYMSLIGNKKEIIQDVKS